MNMKISTMFKGFFVGATMLVPGVSGGSMAMILGEYERLISSVSSFRKDVKGNAFYLMQFVFPALLGMVLLSNPLLSLIEIFTLPMMYLFMGAVLGGVPLVLREAKIKKFKPIMILYVLIGAAIVLLINLIPENAMTQTQGIAGVCIQFAAGIVVSIALVLPGISVSYMLLVMGIYEKVMTAMSNLDILTLLPLFVGLVAGIILTTRALEIWMKRRPTSAYLTIFGFVLGSVAYVFPGVPSGWEIPVCAVFLAAGCAAIYALSAREARLSNASDV